ncbi:AAA family ATPase [Rhodanobacter denitrificans]|nr:AAA family ATPase [Rhodanobacter denitrificans]
MGHARKEPRNDTGRIASGIAKPRYDGLPVTNTPTEAANDAGDLIEVPLGDIMGAMPEPPRFVVDPLIPRRVATLLGGHGGLGKSMLSLTICAHVACGRGWAGFSIEACRAVFVSLEDEAQIVRYRLRRIIEEYQLPAAEVLTGLRIFDGADVEAALMIEAGDKGSACLIETPMMAKVVAAVADAGLAVIDNASDAFAGNENARLQVRIFMRRLAKVARANDAGMVLLAHIDKNAAKNGGAGNNYSGSTAWHNSARSRLALVEDESGIELRHEKANLGKRAEAVRLQRAEHGVLIPAGVDGSRESAAAMVAGGDAEAVLGVLCLAIGAGLTVTTATAGPATAWHTLRQLPELGSQYRTAEGKRRVAAALVRLARDGRIVRAEYKKPDRHWGSRWELPQSAADIAA